MTVERSATKTSLEDRSIEVDPLLVTCSVETLTTVRLSVEFAAPIGGGGVAEVSTEVSAEEEEVVLLLAAPVSAVVVVEVVVDDVSAAEEVDVVVVVVDEGEVVSVGEAACCWVSVVVAVAASWAATKDRSVASFKTLDNCIVFFCFAFLCAYLYYFTLSLL